jgi:putative endonuclease
MPYYVYILYSSNIDRFYVGYSSNPWIRVNQHNSNSKEKYSGRTNDWILKAVFQLLLEKDAIQAERFIKKQKSRTLLVKLCDPTFVPSGKLDQLVRVPHLRD